MPKELVALFAIGGLAVVGILIYRSRQKTNLLSGVNTNASFTSGTLATSYPTYTDYPNLAPAQTTGPAVEARSGRGQF